MNKLFHIAVMLAALVVANLASACGGNQCNPGFSVDWDSGRSIYAHGGFEALGNAESRGLLSQQPAANIVEQYSVSDNIADSYGNLEMDISTCPGDECAGMRVGFDGYSRSGGFGSAYKKTQDGPAHAGAQSRATGNLGAFGGVIRGISSDFNQ